MHAIFGYVDLNGTLRLLLEHFGVMKITNVKRTSLRKLHVNKSKDKACLSRSEPSLLRCLRGVQSFDQQGFHHVQMSVPFQD